MLKKLVFEFFGTFLLVLASGLSEQIGQGGAAVSVGSPNFIRGCVDFLVYASLYSIGAGLSGSHLNPAVSFGFAVLGKLEVVEAIGYCLVQLVAGILGALCFYFFSVDVSMRYSVTVNYSEAFILEIVTGMFVMFCLAKTALHSSSPEYLRGTLTGSAYFVATCCLLSLTCGGFNIARTLPINFVYKYFDFIPLFVIAPFIGALLGVLLFYTINIEAQKRMTMRRTLNNAEIKKLENSLKNERQSDLDNPVSPRNEKEDLAS